MKTRTENYVSPELNIMEIESEGILCASGDNIFGNSFNPYEEDDSWL